MRPKTAKAVIEGFMKGDPTRQSETYQMFCEVLREWRELNDKHRA